MILAKTTYLGKLAPESESEPEPVHAPETGCVGLDAWADKQKTTISHVVSSPPLNPPRLALPHSPLSLTYGHQLVCITSFSSNSSSSSLPSVQPVPGLSLVGDWCSRRSLLVLHFRAADIDADQGWFVLVSAEQRARNRANMGVYLVMRLHTPASSTNFPLFLFRPAATFEPQPNLPSKRKT